MVLKRLNTRRWWVVLSIAILAVGAWWLGSHTGWGLATGQGAGGSDSGPAAPGQPASGETAFKGMAMQDPRPAPDFTLPAADGSVFQLSQQRGKVVLLFFGYTHCPDVCPATLAVWRSLGEELKDQADRVRMVFITVDPERDTPERIREYLPRYGEHIVGLTGSREQLQPVWDAYHVKPERIEMPESSLGYAVAHPAQVSLVDPEGRIRLLYPLGFRAADIAHDVRLLLGEGPAS